MENVRSLINILDLSVEEIDGMVALATKMLADPAAYAHKCDGKILATLFFEPSTRTRLSFESAMLSLGGQVLGFSEASSSSAAKGESVADTVRTVSCYSDIIAMRHNLTVGFCGDLKFGRTVHSLISAMSRYTGTKIVLVSPEELKLPSYVKKEVLQKNGIPYEQTTDLEPVMPELDILYMTRVQRERFFNEEDYLQLYPNPGQASQREGGPEHPASSAARQ